MALSMVFALRREQAGTLYFADLLGASLGAVAVTFLLQGSAARQARARRRRWRRPPRPRCSRARVRIGRGRGRRRAAGAAVAVQERSGFFSITPGALKAMHRHMADASGHARRAHRLERLLAHRRGRGLPDSLARLYIDSDAWTEHCTAGTADVKSIERLPRPGIRALAVQLHARARTTLVIGPGGGSDVLVALALGQPEGHGGRAEPADAALRAPLRRGRRATSTTTRRWRSIQSRGPQLHQPDRPQVRRHLPRASWTRGPSVASGGLSLSENYLYTTEAFRAYYDHLTDDGVLAIMRWRDGHPAPRVERGRAARRGGGGQADRRADREARAPPTIRRR